MDIAAQELNRARGPFACVVADKADQISALWTGRSDAVPRTRRRGERSGHGFTGGQMRLAPSASNAIAATTVPQAVECDAARTDPTDAP